MTRTEPAAELDARYSSEGADPTSWHDAQRELERAGVSWISTVRADGRPHVTTLLTIWLDDELYFCTGAEEQKGRNLAQHAQCILTTGCNTVDAGLDIVVEGEAVNVRDDAKLQGVADAYEAKYGREWHFDVRNGRFHHGGGEALVYEVVPVRVFAFRKGEPFSQTRWRFAEE